MTFRTLTLLVLLGSALVTTGCATGDNIAYAGYNPQRTAPPSRAALAATPCENVLRHEVWGTTYFPTPLERCIPHFPRQAMAAELAATCMSVFALALDGAVQMRETQCQVDGVLEGPAKAAWAAFGDQAFTNAAHTAIGRYRFDPAQAAKLQGRLFSVRSVFTYDDQAPPPPPAMAADVVEIPTPEPKT